ncbi:hypothetical protein BOX15_Mlig006196g1 [Macrostomum lignano]|uniref:Rad60-SLD_2 domain-containing protein n=2 Tax=Macrostomum lignano TaxID=282301 RepID=A0A1I8J3A9_9PLAT|nr:hypothetical protein BOX15_Mlig006196g1 [Macrostomum lignano]
MDNELPMPLVPADRVNLRLLLVSGEVHNFLFNPDDCAQEITDFVFHNWPEGWSSAERPDSNILRLIYHGRFLHPSVTLSALRLPLGKTTVMHLVSRETAPPQPADEERRNSKRSDSGCHCCAVL